MAGVRFDRCSELRLGLVKHAQILYSNNIVLSDRLAEQISRGRPTHGMHANRNHQT